MAHFSPRGYKNPASETEILNPEFWKTVGENQDSRFKELDANQTGAAADAAQALQTANSYAGQIAQANTTAGQAVAIATDAKGTAEAIEGPISTRLGYLEAREGLAPGDVYDVETASVLAQEDSESNAALKAQTAEQLSVRDQVDLVDLVSAHGPRYSTASMVRIGSVMPQVRLHDGERGATYQFIKDTNDDFLKLDAAFVGFSGGFTVGEEINADTGDLTGTWTTATSSWYTTAPGDSFTITTTGGVDLSLMIVEETRGGLWSISVDGGPAVEVSCWGPTTVTDVEVQIASGLNDTPHTIVGTFQGDDPANPPASSPSRGYIRAGSAVTVVTQVGGGGSATQEDAALATASNKEMAFKSGGAAWLPDHGVGSAFQISPPQFTIDGQSVDFAGQANGTETPITDYFELHQRLHWRLSGTNVAEVVTTHRIDARTGVLRFTGRLVALQQITELTGYPMMLPADVEHAQTFVTGLLNRKTSTGDESYSYFETERDIVSSGAVISSTKQDMIAAGTLDAPRLTYRRDKTGTAAEGKQLFVWNRATKPKMYFQSMEEATLNAGDAYAWGFHLIAATIPGAYKMLTT